MVDQKHQKGLNPFEIPENATGTPLLKDLHNYITPSFAAHWRVIGTLLELSSGALNIIKYDNHDKARPCCDAVLEEWLEVDPCASWEKLLKVIETLTVSSDQATDKGVSVFSNIVSQLNLQARFRIDDDTWPPDQPKNFTPLVLIHYKGHRNLQQALTITKLTQTGDIASLASNLAVSKHHPSYEPLQKVLDTSTVTNKVEQILAPLEKNDKPQFILIEGPPGIGKSNLLKEIAYRWGDKQVLNVFRFVLLVCLRDPNVQRITSVLSLLQLFCVGHTKAPEIIDACNDHLFENAGKDLIILLDGFDEFPVELQKNSLVSKILERHVLPNCGLIVSSRPHASENLRKQATLRVDILGFTEIERTIFIRQALPHAVEELTKYLENNVTIGSLCFIPFNMVILVYLYKQGIALPSNSTQLYNYFICLTICRHLAKSGHSLDNTITDLAKLPEPYNTIIQQLSNLSLNSLNKNKLIFTLEEMKAACPDLTVIPGALNAFGLLQAIQHFGLTGKTMTFNFVHFSIQEFLAAYHITQLPPHEELRVLKGKFWNNLHSNVFAMYTSLTKGQRSAFKQFLAAGDNTIMISEMFTKDHLKCIHLFRCFYEANHKAHCMFLQKSCDKVINVQSSYVISPYDVECITLFLTCSTHKQWTALRLYGCQIQDSGFLVLYRNLRCTNITIKQLYLSFNNITRSSLISELTIHCRVEVLWIDGNRNIGEDPALYDMLFHPSSRLVRLDMECAMLSSYSTIVLFTALAKGNKLQQLYIGHNNITDEACDVIAEVLKYNSSLVKLVMRYNSMISEEAAQQLVEALKLNSTLEELHLPYGYPEDVRRRIRSLQGEINDNRQSKECLAKLNIVCL